MKNFIPIIILFGIFLLITLLAIYFSPATLLAGSKLQPLSVGNRMPDIHTAISINNTPIRYVDFSHGSRKLIILEFISTWCHTCLESVQHLEELQRTFPEDISIFLITPQPDTLVRQIAGQYNWSLPIITEDSILGALFPHQVVPHQVWVKDQEIIAITDWQYANPANILQVLSGHPPKTHLKHEDSVHLEQPFSAGSPWYQSLISPPISYGSGMRMKDNQFLLYNADIPRLYQHAFGMPVFPLKAYVSLEVSDSLRQLILGPPDHITGYFPSDSIYLHWREHFTFCYSLTWPQGTTIHYEELQPAMQADLNRFFEKHMGITAVRATRKIPCLALISTDPQHHYASTGAEPFLSTKSADYKIINKPIRLFINQIAYRHHLLGMPVINATGYTGNVDLFISGGLADLNTVNQALATYDLRFTVQDHDIEVIAIQQIADPATPFP